jgi:hypothetical protein
MILSGIHDFNDLEAGFPTKTASGMTFGERIKVNPDQRLPAIMAAPMAPLNWGCFGT